MSARTLTGVQALTRGSLPLVAMFVVGWLSALGYSSATRGEADRVEGGSALEASRRESAAGSERFARTAGTAGKAGKAGKADADAAELAAAHGALYSQSSGPAVGASVTAGQVVASETAVAPAVAKWKADATGDDSAARASAIISLANAPKLQALPVLQRVLTSGEPQVDRPLALKSLRTLALTQGDADGGIRNVLREAIYHGGDEATTQGAQSVLDDVEGAASKTPPVFTRQR
ncbi:MAG: hypothetical protein ABI885_08990 [Gammaproteobacteria bacterium]